MKNKEEFASKLSQYLDHVWIFCCILLGILFYQRESNVHQFSLHDSRKYFEDKQLQRGSKTSYCSPLFLFLTLSVLWWCKFCSSENTAADCEVNIGLFGHSVLHNQQFTYIMLHRLFYLFVWLACTLFSVFIQCSEFQMRWNGWMKNGKILIFWWTSPLSCLHTVILLFVIINPIYARFI